MSEPPTNSSRDRRLRLKDRILYVIVPWLIVLIQRFIGFTSRRVDINSEDYKALLSQGKPFILGIWHTNVLFSPYLNRNLNAAVMISASKDGEYIHRVVVKNGNYSVRGSTSRGGVGALKLLVRQLKNGNIAAVTPDGPRGPAFVLQAGIVMAAQIAGVPIIPFHYECTRQKVLENAWDKHRLPLPFTTFVVRYGNPILVPPELAEDELETVRRQVEQAMLENMRLCEQAANEMRSAQS